MDDALLVQVVSQLTALPERALSMGWQGGEPTLMGLPFFERAMELLMRFGRGQQVGNSLQTNGMLIDKQWAAFLARYNFLVGLSMDGPKHIHDHYRKHVTGSGTFDRVFDALSVLLDMGVMVNILSVVTDFSASYASESYNFFKSNGLTFQQYIPCVEPSPIGTEKTERYSVTPAGYGSFLITLFDEWNSDFVDGYPSVSIRFFDALLNRYLKREPSDCTLLEHCGNYLVIEHNGDIYPCDFFVDSAHKLGNVKTDSLGAVFEQEAMRTFGQFKGVLPDACQCCSWRSMCQGGCPKDRPPNRESYLCEAFKLFFAHADPILKQRAATINRLESENRKREVAVALQTGNLSPKRNDPCPCGSGKKFKKCCMP